MKKPAKTLKIVLISILAVILTILTYEIGVGAIIYEVNVNNYKHVKPLSNKITYENINGINTFVTDDEFKILHLTDTHIGAGALSADNDYMALNAIEKLVVASDPDLVVVTGDLVYPSKIRTFNDNNLRSLMMLSILFETLKVHWCPVFGNHDSEKGSEYTREELGTYLERLQYCMFEKGPSDIDGVGNYVVNIQNSSGRITQSLYFMDSNDYVHKSSDRYDEVPGNYDNIHENQIQWYETKVNEINQINKDNGFDEIVKSILFTHIPFEEYEEAYTHGTIISGEKKEEIWEGVNYGMFDKIVELGSTQLVLCGHDHLNNFVAEYKGVKLAYGLSIDYIAYFTTKFTSSQRGGTEVLVSSNGEVNLNSLKYKDIK